MHKLRLISINLFLVFLLTSTASAQLILGQYEDEAPARSWNTSGLVTAASMGFGGVPMAFSLDAASSLINPALLISGPRISILTNASAGKASFFRYGVVNTGVLETANRISSATYALDFIGTAIRAGRLAIGASLSLLETYSRPRTVGSESYSGETVYSLEFKQSGYLWNINLSAAYEISSRLSIGAGVNRVFGAYEKNLREDLFYNGNVITDEKTLDYRGFFVTAGLLFRPTGKFSLAVSARSPYQKRAEGVSLYRFQNSGTSTDVRIESSGESRFFQPAVFGVGAGYHLDQHWRFSLNMAYFNWSRYTVNYFEEERPRVFRNIIQVYGGLEYRRNIRLFGRIIDTPFRVGFCYDPQPVTAPSYNYLYLALSSGFNFGKLSLNLSLMLGGERSSGENLVGQRIALSLGYSID
jgi:hypothetical protein